MTVEQLAQAIDAQVVGDGAVEITSAATLDDALRGQVSFLANPKYATQLQTTRASAVVVGKNVEPVANTTLLRAADPYYAFMQAVVKLHGHRRHPFSGVHPQAHVDPSATIGENTIVYPSVFIGPRVKIGRDCIIYPSATIYDDCVLGDRVIVQAGSAIGVDGYGYATHDGVHHKMPQIGNVIIEDDVEIGANCSIERGALGSTVIGKGTKIDQLVVIGHGSKIGEYCLIVAQTGIAGSVTLGHHVVLAGQSGVAGHLNIGNKVTAGAKSGIINDVEDGTTLMGQPAMPVKHARRVYILFTQLPDLAERIKALEEQVRDLAANPIDDEGDGAEVV
jgi:UDP-3-O-[3-hydroxymyristoyl] glucosamine N-acyltransferase